jgi:hypothetical protein
MAFMVANYLTFMFDHWILATGLTGQVFTEDKRSTLANAYWSVLDLNSLFFVLLWNDRLYNRPGVSFFHADPLQQASWLFVLAANVILSIATRSVPFHSFPKWILKQVFVWGIILLVGILISLH